MQAVTPSPTSVTVVGSFQQAIGCPADWMPACPRTRLQYDPGADLWRGSFTIPAGSYSFKVALDDSWRENYGADATRDGPDIPLLLPVSETVTFIYDHQSHWFATGSAGSPHGSLAQARAHWLARDTIAWPGAASARCAFRLHAAPDGDMQIAPDGVRAPVSLDLLHDPHGIAPATLAKFPHLAGASALRIAEADLARVPELLRGQLAVSLTSCDGTLLTATALQIPGVLDDLYANEAPLGVTWRGDTLSLSVWAPTARRVRLRLYDGPRDKGFQTLEMQRDDASGVWSIAGEPGWRNRYYCYEVEVFVRGTGRVETNVVTDPYALALSTNSQRAQIVDLRDPALKPDGWDTLQKPLLDGPHDIVLYELHVRDFSISDPSVPAPLRGTYGAFAERGGNGMRHLRALAEAGLSHIHLLPVYDFATVDEDPAQRSEPDAELLRSYPPDSGSQASLVSAHRYRDGFNWGYDPWHYTVPEGSYAREADGGARTREFRTMVQALAKAGLRVVMDVVYNHTYASGQGERSVLDRVVPGYYHRLDAVGNVESSTCCANTASEHAMMGRLMRDSLVTWARDYKVDGFRFDLMGHHMRADMVAARDALRALTPERDGVDGQKIFLYGEGWDFGEVAFNARGVNATQRNLPGTGVATFNDRLRDAVRGGGASGGLQEQGFVTGLAYEPNEWAGGSAREQLHRLLALGDQIRVGIAGNLADFPLVDANGHSVTGALVPYHGQATGYAVEPTETITYVEAHDNETLWDVIQIKAARSATVEERVRMHCLALSIVALGQGVPFFQAGQDMLRSKSLDRNSYDSGDWFNRIDWSYETNNWGVGLPPGESEAIWPLIRPLLANPALRVRREHILSAVGHFRELLRLRRSTRLLRLGSAEAVRERLRFLNTGPNQIPGLIAFHIDGAGDAALGGPFRSVAVVINARTTPQAFVAPSLASTPFALHPLQADSHDPLVREARFDPAEGVFHVPERTAAVYVQPA
jgi:pullulanase-type alpha-1,6-glucosidase